MSATAAKYSATGTTPIASVAVSPAAAAAAGPRIESNAYCKPLFM